MKILHSQFKSIRGNTLLITIVVTGLIGFLLASYMGLVRSQNIATMRSQSWNATVPVVEAGIEDALTHINIRLTNDLIGDGWTKPNNVYQTMRWIGSNKYTVTISNWVVGSPTNQPVIESRGYVVAPVTVASIDGVTPVFATAGGGNVIGVQFIARGIRCTTRTDALFSKGLVAKGQIDLAGNNILSDSYDSRDTNASTGGMYDITKRKDNGSVATNSGLTNSLNVGNADIYGKISTGPGGSIAIGPNGRVGSEAFVDEPSNNGQIETDHFTDDMNVDFADVKLPPLLMGGFTPSAGVIDGTNYTYVLGDDNYRLTSLSMNSGTMIVTGRAALWVQGTLDIGGTAKIVIAPGGSLTLYMSGASAKLTGNGVVNQNANALAFSYYGLPSNTSISLNGNGTFTGTIYAPNAEMTLNGGGGGGEDFSGAAIAKSVRMNGHFKFHYDEALMVISPPRGYIVTTWDEMSPQEVAQGPSF